MNDFPFIEEKVDNAYIRTFSQDVDLESLQWHWDEEDRIVEVVNPTNWMFQFDNELPIDMNNKKLFIPKGKWHRVIKGDGDLVVKVIKLKN